MIENEHVKNSTISEFRQAVGEHCALLGYYEESSCNYLPTFRDNLSGPIFKGQELRGCPETSVRNYHYSLRDSPEERSSHVKNFS